MLILPSIRGRGGAVYLQIQPGSVTETQPGSAFLWWLSLAQEQLTNQTKSSQNLPKVDSLCDGRKMFAS